MSINEDLKDRLNKISDRYIKDKIDQGVAVVIDKINSDNVFFYLLSLVF